MPNEETMRNDRAAAPESEAWLSRFAPADRERVEEAARRLARLLTVRRAPTPTIRAVRAARHAARTQRRLEKRRSIIP